MKRTACFQVQTPKCHPYNAKFCLNNRQGSEAVLPDNSHF